MFKNFTSLFRISPEQQRAIEESNRAWYALQNSINSTFEEINLRSNLMNQKMRNDNMRLALQIKAEREKLLKQ